MDPCIKVTGLGKQYRIGGSKKPYRTIRESLVDGLTAPFRKTVVDDSNSFWALKDVNFEIQPGEVVGVIGRNGAGKSTLLKILSRITDPTEGEIDIVGRVGSLLEVGTGFHPELTGRENVFLNGAILGMRKSEIAAKFDEIVSFAETEKFLDTPVKYYSSGMYMRLAFAVAAHLDPEILIVDEVLAVGDAQFQKKCMGKMDQVAKRGRTVLFVSHNLAAIQNLCTKGVFLQGGKVQYAGPIDEAVARYRVAGESTGEANLADRRDRYGTREAVVERIELIDADGNPINAINPGERFGFRMTGRANGRLASLAASVNIDTIDSARVTTLWSAFNGVGFDVEEGPFQLDCQVRDLVLRPDVYTLEVFLGSGAAVCDYVQRAVTIEVRDNDYYAAGKTPERQHGPVMANFSWAQRKSVTA